MNLYDLYSSKKINLTENPISASDVEKQIIDENLHKWFKEKWVRFGPDGKIRGDCARGDDSEGKPKCLPQSKAHSLGKKGRASAASRKRREDPNPERRGAAINVNTKKKSNEDTEYKPKSIYDQQNAEWEQKTKNLPRKNPKDLPQPSKLSRIMGGEKISDVFMTQQDKEDKARRIRSYAAPANPSSSGRVTPAPSGSITPSKPSEPVSRKRSFTPPEKSEPVATSRSIGAAPTTIPSNTVPSTPTPSSATNSKQSWQDIYNLNKQTIGKNPNLIKIGQQLKLPNGKIYTVGKGDNLYNIARGIYKGKLSEDFQFSPEQEKWIGSGDKQNPYILARMPGAKPPPEYFSDPKNQKIAQQIYQSQDLANKWQQFRQSGSLTSNILSRVPGVNKAANVIDVGANVVKGDFAAAGKQALGMIPAAKPINLALQQSDDLVGNVKKGNYIDATGDALRTAAVNKISNKLNLPNQIKETENTCPQCGGVALDNEILAEKKDACYHKVKSRYKVWPSAYASGALVKCRKKGAKNWGKSKTNEDTNLYFNVTGTDKKTLISEFKLQHNAKGWYLNENSSSSLKLDAVRAFGMPLSEEELNPIAYDGTAATIGTDKGKSPVGSIPKSQRINKRRGKV